jgi:hypothetical protein
MTIPLVIGVNPLQTTLFELGIVSGRVALLLRSAEIHPVFVRFVSALRGNPPSLRASKLQGGQAKKKRKIHKGNIRVCALRLCFALALLH